MTTTHQRRDNPTFVPFLIISLPISNPKIYSVKDAFQEYSKIEQVNDVICEACEDKGGIRKKFLSKNGLNTFVSSSKGLTIMATRRTNSSIFL